MPETVDWEALPQAITGLGVVSVLFVLGEWVVFAGLRPELILHPRNVASLVIDLPFVLWLLYGGYWLEGSDLPPERYTRIAGWCIGVLVVWVVLNVLLMLSSEFETLWEAVGWLRWAAVIGSGTGLLIGIIEARAIERERSAARAAARAEYVESQRDRLDYLNSLLRHEVLNTANIISGQAALLKDAVDPDDPAYDRLETIDRRSEDLTSVIRDVRVLLDAAGGDPDLAPMDLVGVLRAEVEDLRDHHDRVDVALSAPDRLLVDADDLLPRLFSNLLVNAVEHHDGDRPQVRVTVEATDEVARLRIADDGPGIPDPEREDLFERESGARTDHGLGLYLVSTLAERYGGRVELTETGADGTTFTVVLPRAETDSGASNDPRSAAAPASVPGRR